jgi:glycine/D-amino acid oxidase-like deaminating enzyme
MNEKNDADVIVIGGGLIGSAVAYGLLRHNQRVLVLDGEDRDYRAANANGGLVWLQGKGANMPAYHSLSRLSVAAWPEFCAELEADTGSDIQYVNRGGLKICFGEAGLEQRRESLMRWHNQQSDWEMLDRACLEKLVPNVEFGFDVAGASYCQGDGQLNPLRLLAALHSAIGRKGGELRGGAPVHAVRPSGDGGFVVDFAGGRASAPRIVIAAGLGCRAIAAQVGLDIPIRPQRGQMLITERLDPFLPLPMHTITQTGQGTVMIGTTNEEVGFDNATTVSGVAGLSALAVRSIPALSRVNIVRQWAGLRIMTPDGGPIYAESTTHPGAFVAACHSGVTLAAAHAGILADAIATGQLPSSLDDFHHRRFDVPQAA